MTDFTDVLFRAAIRTILDWIHPNKDVRSRCVFGSQPILELRASYRLCPGNSLHCSARFAIPQENRHFVGGLE